MSVGRWLPVEVSEVNRIEIKITFENKKSGAGFKKKQKSS
jgi:hypothetical protein